MKTPFTLTGRLRVAVIASFLAFAFQPTDTTAQTINIGPNQYAFRFTVNPNYGLFFNAASTRYEFRNGLAASVFGINADNGNLTNDLQFASGFTYRVPANNWAIRSASAPNAGIFFGPVDFEFRTSGGTSAFRMNATTGNITLTGTLTALGGNSTQWNQAVAWGNHATAGYVSQTGLASGSVPRWNGTQLGVSAITAGTSSAAVTGLPSTIGIVGAPSGYLLLLENPGGGTVFQSNESRISFSKANVQKIQIGTADDDFIIRMASTERFRMTPNGNTGFGIAPESSSTILADKSVSGSTGAAISGTVSYVGNSDVRGVSGNSVTNPGYGYGVYGTGGYMGVRGLASSTTYTGTAYGVYGSATGSEGTRVGVYGTASGGTTNWAGYFVGNEYISGDLRVGSTTGATGYKVSVNGKIMCTEARVQAVANWPDYVFGESYELMSLEDLETFVKTEKHLPGVPSASEVEAEEGFDLGGMQKIALEKIEELTLYLIEQNKLIKQQQAEIEWLKTQVKQ